MSEGKTKEEVIEFIKDTIEHTVENGMPLKKMEIQQTCDKYIITLSIEKYKK